MARPQDPRDGIDRLLARALREDAGVVRAEAGGCPDADLLAAFAERGLSGEESSVVEHHVSHCARCQEVLAAIIEPTSGEQPLPAAGGAVPWWRASWWRLAAPLAAAGLALAVYVAVRPVGAPQQSALHDEAARQRPTAGEVDLPLPSAQTGVTRPAENVLPVDGVDRSADPARAPAREDRAPSSATGAVSPHAPATLDVPAQASVAAHPGEAAPQEVSGGRATPPAAEAISAAALERERRSSAPIATAEQARSATAAAPAPLPSAGPAGWLATTAPPGARRLWRVGRAGAIASSADGGASWTPHWSGVAEDLLAVSAPTHEVCWAAGRNGVVLRTLDAGTWERVSAPAGVDLVAIEARDGQSATVTTADGRRFATRDGGRTWIAR